VSVNFAESNDVPAYDEAAGESYIREAVVRATDFVDAALKDGRDWNTNFDRYVRRLHGEIGGSRTRRR
jgi:hypothetical protein